MFTYARETGREDEDMNMNSNRGTSGEYGSEDSASSRGNQSSRDEEKRPKQNSGGSQQNQGNQ